MWLYIILKFSSSLPPSFDPFIYTLATHELKLEKCQQRDGREIINDYDNF